MNTPNGLHRSLWRIASSASLAILALFILPALAAAQTVTYSNTSSITLPENNVASTYPSTINVSGGTGVVTKVTVTLTNLNQRPADMDILLVGPTGVKVILTEDQGGNTNVTNRVWTFDDAAAAMITGTSPVSGTYMPSHDGTFTSLPTPAPTSTAGSPYSGQLSSFIGTNANGNWSLYIDDDNNGGGSGSLAGGWSISVTYGQVFTSGAAITVPGTGFGPAVSAPYPAPVTVSGYSGSYITKATVRLNTAVHSYTDDVALLLVGPGGQNVRLTADSGGSANLSGNYVFDSTAAKTIPDAVATTNVPATTYQPSTGDDSAPNGSDPMIANFPAPAPAAPYGTNLNVFNLTQPNGTWNLYIYDDTNQDNGSIASWSLIIETSAVPTAAPAQISGRLVTPKGQGIRGVVVTLRGGDLTEPIMTTTTTFGRYSFPGLLAGQTYIVSVRGKKYIFGNPVRVVSLEDSLTDIDFVSSP